MIVELKKRWLSLFKSSQSIAMTVRKLPRERNVPDHPWPQEFWMLHDQGIHMSHKCEDCRGFSHGFFPADIDKHNRIRVTSSVHGKMIFELLDIDPWLNPQSSEYKNYRTT